MNQVIKFDANTVRVFFDEHGPCMLDYALYESETEYEGPLVEPSRIDVSNVGASRWRPA